MNLETGLLLGGNLSLLIIMAAVSGWLIYQRLRRVPPAALRQYEQTIADMQARLERTEQRSDRQQEQIDRLRDMLAQEQDYNRALARAMRDAGLEPPRRADVIPPPPPTPAQLNEAIALRFDAGEIAGLAFELGVGDALTGDSIQERARSLVDICHRRGLLPRLIELCRRERPNGGF